MTRPFTFAFQPSFKGAGLKPGSTVNGGLLSVDEACERYGLTLEEFAGWQRAVDRSGMPGLRVTRIQHYKSLYERQQKF
jgi:hypothetical protein